MTPARRVDDVDDDKAPGAFKYFADSARTIAGMVYVCPCGCGRQGALQFRPYDGERASWQWDGNEAAPTLTPSVHHRIGGETHWHGYLTAGEWRPC